MKNSKHTWHVVFIFYKGCEYWIANIKRVFPKGNIGLGSCEPLVIKLFWSKQHITFFDVCFCLETGYLIYILESLTLNSWLTCACRKLSNTRIFSIRIITAVLCLGTLDSMLALLLGVVLYSEIVNQEENNAKKKRERKKKKHTHHSPKHCKKLHFFIVWELKQENRTFVSPQLGMCPLDEKFFTAVLMSVDDLKIAKQWFGDGWPRNSSERENSQRQNVWMMRIAHFSPWPKSWYHLLDLKHLCYQVALFSGFVIFLV